jgi:polyisoprenoid-binding protein YceI
MELGPDNGRLTVRTKRAGAAAKAGHDLLIEVTRWSATLDDGAIALEADPRSLRVLEGTGGISALDEGDKAGIAQTIDEDVLKGAPIVFRSTRVARAGGRLDVEGELELAGVRRPIAFALDVAGDGGVAGSAQLRQSDWRIKPFSALFGTLKVADVVEVRIETRSDDIG